MNPIIPIIAFAALIYGAQYIRKGEAILSLVTTPLKVKVSKKSGFFSNLISPELLLTLKVENPNRTAVKFQSIRGELYYNNKVLTTFDYRIEINVPALDSAILQDMKLRVNTANLGTQILELFKSDLESANTDVICKGVIVANGMTYPFNKATKIDLTA